MPFSNEDKQKNWTRKIVQEIGILKYFAAAAVFAVFLICYK